MGMPQVSFSHTVPIQPQVWVTGKVFCKTHSTIGTRRFSSLDIVDVEIYNIHLK